MRKVALIGPVYPFRAGIAHCTTRLAEELEKSFDLMLISFSRQYPRMFYPGRDDVDETLRQRTPPKAQFLLDILNPATWTRTARMLRDQKVEAVILVWWVWVWALPYLLICLNARARVLLLCHNVSDKEPAWWKSMLTTMVLFLADWILVHASTEEKEVRRRIGKRARVVRTFLPAHEMGGLVPARGIARTWLNVKHERVALFFGHVRPFKGLDVALEAWRQLNFPVLLLVAGEIWWGEADEYREMAVGLEDHVRFETRFIPDAEIADYFAVADVVLAPYRREAQSGVAMTAFHFGRPVIATRVGGLPEVVEHGVNGLLVEPVHPPSLAAAVDQFFSRCDRQAMEKAALRTAARYSWEEYAAGVSELIERMIGNDGATESQKN